MPRSNLDWLGIFSLWLGALIMAIKAGDLPLVVGAPILFMSSFWSFAPIILVTFYLLVAIHNIFYPKHQEIEAHGAVSHDDTDLVRKREIIANGRSFIAAFNRQDKVASFMDFLEQQDGWHAMRRYLDKDVLNDMESRRHFVASPRGTNKDGKTGYLASEMDRLEHDWGLLER